MIISKNAFDKFYEIISSILDNEQLYTKVIINKDKGIMTAMSKNTTTKSVRISTNEESREILNCLASRTDILNIKNICVELNKLLLRSNLIMAYFFKENGQFDVIIYKYEINTFCNFFEKNFSKIQSLHIETFIINETMFKELEKNKENIKGIFKELEKGSIGYREPVTSSSKNTVLSVPISPKVSGIVKHSQIPCVINGTVSDNISYRTILKCENNSKSNIIEEKASQVSNKLQISLKCLINDEYKDVCFDKNNRLIIKKNSENYEAKLLKMTSFINEMYGLQLNVESSESLIGNFHNKLIVLSEADLMSEFVLDNDIVNLHAEYLKNGNTNFSKCNPSIENSVTTFYFMDGRDAIFVDTCEII